MAFRHIEPPAKRWPARDEVRALAREYTVKAMTRLIELMDADSQFVAVTAARTVLMRGQPEPRKNPRIRPFRRIGQRGASEVKVTIARFKEEKQGGGKKRRSGLPVVPGRREGSRDAGDAGGAGMPALRRKRTGVRGEPAVRHGTAQDVPGTGA